MTWQTLLLVVLYPTAIALAAWRLVRLWERLEVRWGLVRAGLFTAVLAFVIGTIIARVATVLA